MITDTNTHISEPKKNQVVFFKPWQGKKDAKKKAYPVIINDGEFFTKGIHGGLCNFWDWQRVSPSGRINKNVEKGYGNFTIAEGFGVKVVTNTITIGDKSTSKLSRKITVF
jgi:hypothetical protein